ncbi:MAG: hypothetical protein ACK4E3_01605 [Brevundimonas sp.]|uniref:hypothetical protein n=1 Tax=Brevundimonas sp. TaxID=1871086 RepID=UPI00391B7BBD
MDASFDIKLAAARARLGEGVREGVRETSRGHAVALLLAMALLATSSVVMAGSIILGPGFVVENGALVRPGEG